MASETVSYVANTVYTLLSPPTSSWVAKVAAMFRILALMLFTPMILITALDVASYLIVRTLGTPLEATTTSPSIHPTHSERAASYVDTDLPHGTNLQLSGGDTLSPPPSRSASPGVPSSRKDVLNMTSISSTQDPASRSDGAQSLHGSRQNTVRLRHSEPRSSAL
ncbi:hypothetical protein SISSUDRAFT_1125594 [Sistotremastrum suecicum HHB10207 ss-3]|uniref:Uncharacterized protein n=1 Tax=Sistotremastrum suecicum HHB10207 ss-3 TaxID=1314776 RepID=A0A166H825_9AGAM|nr:hypothetical protein SISSUDRAFT_1125594 [Sistotremastrum suecicum HHB10207 ss-3]